MRKRTYPIACQSAQCGRTACPETCPHLSALLEFKRWQHITGAYRPDPVWSPSVWVASKAALRNPWEHASQRRDD